MVKWLSCLPSKQAARVRFPFGVIFFSRLNSCCVSSDIVQYLASSISMKQLFFKRRRVSSNPHTPLPSSDALVDSLKPSRTSTCTSCHRAVRLKLNPAFLCARFIVFSLDLLIDWSHHICWVNTTGATHQPVSFVCGRARVIQY